MTLRFFLSFHAIICFIFGILCALLPTVFEPVYGIVLNPVGELVSRWLGATLLGLGMITWLARNEEKSELRSSILMALFIADFIGAVVAFWSQLTGIMNDWGWSLVVIWILLAMGFGYFRYNEGI